jgi:hypothetical protein
VRGLEKALILGTLSQAFPKEILNNFKGIKGVLDAGFLFGPYDFYVLANSETREKLNEIALQVRFNKGVASTVTCNVVDESTINLVRAHTWE